MKKILGLDLGGSSIGWAYVLEDEQDSSNNQIVAAGTRIVPLDAKERDEFAKGGNVPTNHVRRMARQMRRNHQRYRFRRQHLHQFLQQNGLFPDDLLLRGLRPVDLYALRDKAVTEKITPAELGRVFIHLNLRRGYKSSRKDASEEATDKKQSNYLEQIAEREAQIKTNHQTIGQYLYTGLKNNPDYRVREQIFNRQSYLAEFDAIWDTQKKYHPEILTEQNYKLLRDRILYFQRPLKSQKGLVGECALEWYYALDKNGAFKYSESGQKIIARPKCAPKSSPLAQEVRIWENIHNIRIWDERNQAYVLNDAEKRVIYEVLQEKRDLTANAMLKLLKLSPNVYTTDTLIREKGLKGNTTKIKILEILKKWNISSRDILAFNLDIEEVTTTDLTTGEEFRRLQVKSSFEEEPLYRFWHLIYATEQDDILIKLLQDRYGFTAEQAEDLTKINFNNDGFSNKSSRAMRRILPHLRAGLDYASASAKARYKHSNSLTTAENNQRILLNSLSVLKKNSLRNPVVEKVLNQMIQVINDILQDPDMGRPDEIRVELARELKQSAKERDRTFSKNNKRERENKDIRKLIGECLGINEDAVSKLMIEKWRLYHEVGKVSLYTGKSIELKKLLLGEGVDIEHIIPKSRCFDDSFENKTICETNYNQIKDKMTARDFMESQTTSGLQTYDAYLRRINDLYKMNKSGGKEGEGISKAKYQRLLMAASEIPDDFISRQLRETQYIAKKATEILTEVCYQVQSTSGSVTDFLRHQWGWDELLHESRFQQFKNQGLTEIRSKHKGTQTIERIQNWTKRMDHRHHALDALVIACTKPALIRDLNLLNQQYGELKGDERRQALFGQKQMVPPAPFSNPTVLQAMDHILVSFKQGQRVATLGKKSHNSPQKRLSPRGALHEETIYGQIKFPKVLELNAKFNPAWIENLVHEHQKALLLERLELYEGNAKKAFGELAINPIYYGKNAKKTLKKVSIWEYSYVSRKKVDPDLTAKQVEKVSNEALKAALNQRLATANGDPKVAFKNLAEQPVLINGKVVKRVRVRNNAPELIQTPRGFVESGSNHHVAIYEDANGKKHEQVVPFWDAFLRKRLGLPVIIKDPKSVFDTIALAKEGTFPDKMLLPEANDWKFVVSLKINDYFVFGLDPAEIDFLDPKNSKLISKHLFRVRKLTSGAYWFLHHLETQILEDTVSKESNRAKYCSMASLTGIKVTLNRLGRIIAIGENAG
jgi:CRISPR-associated endonuclease Csn1